MCVSKNAALVIALATLICNAALPALASPVKWTFDDTTFQTFEGIGSPTIDHPVGWFIYDADVFQGDRMIDWSIDFSADGQRGFRPNPCPPDCFLKNASQTDGPDNTDVFAFGGALGTPQESDFLGSTVQKLTDAGGRSTILDGFFSCCESTTSFLISGSLLAVPEADSALYVAVALIALCTVRRWKSPGRQSRAARRRASLVVQEICSRATAPRSNRL